MTIYYLDYFHLFPDYCLGYTFPSPVRILGASFVGNLVTVLDDDVYLCRTTSTALRNDKTSITRPCRKKKAKRRNQSPSPGFIELCPTNDEDLRQQSSQTGVSIHQHRSRNNEDVHFRRETANAVRNYKTTLDEQRRTVVLTLQNYVTLPALTRISSLETFGDSVYVGGENEALLPHPVLPRTTDNSDYFESYQTADLAKSESQWSRAFQSMMTMKRPTSPKYLVAADDAKVYKLSCDGGQRRKLKSVSVETAFRSSFWRKRAFSAGVRKYGEQDYGELLKLSLLRVVAQNGHAAVGDRSGNVFHLDGDHHLHLYGKDQREVYDFGRLPVDGRRLEPRRMCLDEDRRLLFVWCRSEFLDVFSYSRRL